MPSFFVPARDSRHRAACLALYRALLRQVPRISLPDELLSRSGWTHPIRYLLRTGFQRNKTDTSPRLVASALKSGYRFLTLLTRAHDAASPQHAEIIAFLRERQKQFPPPRPPTPEPPRERPPPLLTRVSAPGEKPVYKSTVRPLPLAKLTGGVRKVPVMEETSSIAFLRIGKPQSHWHANFLRRKGDRRQARITAMQKLWEDVQPAAADEDAWECQLEELADEEGVDIPDVGDEVGLITQGNGNKVGPFEYNVREFGVKYIKKLLNEEAEDMLARSTAMLDIRDEEKRLAELEKKEKKERRFRAWEEWTRQQERDQDLNRD